ncbi:MAG TPA: patatin-like phospholipase family protein [Stellaceae bacterium]|nr:patatin-like phospholipase family protein [Stellaceae bacterium]
MTRWAKADGAAAEGARASLRQLVPRALLAPLRRERRKRLVSLALQGGGSFGAFTWGVLDRLLERDDLAIDTVSGVSAGAVNAVLLASGLAEGGPAEARRRLERFWQRVSRAQRLGRAASGTAALALELSMRMLSPYQLNPLGLNPLREILAAEIDFARLRETSPIRLLIGATRVKDGRLRLFRTEEITLEAVLASACLPQIQHAVAIEGEWYWDGGFSANPPLRQLVLDSLADDVVLVQITPEAQSGGAPVLLNDITRRVNQITFNGPLQREIEALADLCAVCGRERYFRSRLCRKLRRLRLHRIAAEDVVEGLQQASAMALDRRFLRRLREGGRQAAEDWATRLAQARA